MITRREFLQLSGLSLAVMLTPEGYRLLKAKEVEPPYSPEIWLNLSEDNFLTVLINKSEMGQGVYTGLPQIVAEELDFPWDRVKPMPAPAGRRYVDPKWGVQLTGGSTSVRNMYEFLRYVGASMKEMLIRAVVKELGVSPDSIEAKGGYIYVGKSKYPYGRFAKTAGELPIPEEPKLKSEEEFIYIGRSLPRLDVPDKVNGRAEFGIDTFIEGMVYAVVERAPFGSRPKKVSAEEAKRIKGFLDVVPLKESVAVCGESLYACLKAREKLKVEWTRSPIEGWGDEDFEKFFLKKLQRKGRVARKDGRPEEVYRRARIKLEDTYILPYLYHATMEPMSCTAWVKEDECIVFAPVQAQTSALRRAKKVTGLPEERIKVFTTYLGGGFGRKSNVEFVEEALLLSKRLKRPVKLIYTREDDVSSGWYRPMSATQIRGSITEDGRVESFMFRIAVPSVFESAGRRVKMDPAAVEGVRNMFYEIPNIRVEWVRVDLPVPVWFWRSVGSTHNAFTVETFLDRLAYEVKKDPVEMRLELLETNPRAYRVVEYAAEVSGWGKGPGKGDAMGLAYHYSFGSHVAEVAEVTYRDGKLRVDRVVCVIDIGPMTVNPDLIVSQMESAIVMGLSAMLREKVSFSEGRVRSTNFDSYPLLRMDEAPEIEVHILNSEGPMGGVGEPGLPPVAPAVANALLWGYGMKINRLPLLS